MTQTAAESTEEVFGISDQWDRWIAVSVKTTRTMFKCKACKHVWARNYRRAYKVMPETCWSRATNRSYRIEAVYEYHRLENGKTIRQDQDYECPQCHATNKNNTAIITANNVAGTRTDKKCDARCTGAKGHNCECSCGSENHGKDRLV